MAQAQLTIDTRMASPGAAVLDIQGELTAFGEKALTGAYDQANSQGAKCIILNFENLGYMNSSGIGLLVTLLVRINRAKQKLYTYGLSEHYRHIFQLTRLDDAIGIYDTEADALQAARA